MRRVLGLAVLTVALGGALAGQGTRSGVLLTLPTSTRALGLGDASGSVTADEWATFLAPAQLARARSFSAGMASEAYLASTQLSAVALAIPAWRGTIGIGATMLDYGSVREIASALPGLDGVETGRTVSAQDNAIVLGYGRAIPKLRGVRAGASVEWVQTRVVDLSGQGTALAAGLGWTSRSGWDVTASVQHVGGAITVGATRGVLPQTFRAGVAAPDVHVRSARLRPMIEVRDVRGAGSSSTLAGELTWPGIRGAEFTVRSGYTARYSGDDRAPLSLGAGVGLGRFSLDYALERFSRIDQTTHRVGLRFARAPAVSASSSR